MVFVIKLQFYTYRCDVHQTQCKTNNRSYCTDDPKAQRRKLVANHGNKCTLKGDHRSDAQHKHHYKEENRKNLNEPKYILLNAPKTLSFIMLKTEPVARNRTWQLRPDRRWTPVRRRFWPPHRYFRSSDYAPNSQESRRSWCQPTDWWMCPVWLRSLHRCWRNTNY